jgi:5-formyltetrahydrofolate cyclo-ligase
MHEVDGMLSTWEQIRPWRVARRKEWLALRMARPVEERQALERDVLARLGSMIDVATTPILGIYFPIRAEIDVRGLAQRHVAAGGTAALPVVVEKNAPVEFWQWEPGGKTKPGLWGIPIPRERVVVQPQTLIVPLVGFDRARYRLGYGGGYYDRTLAAANPRPRTIGIAHSDAELPTIHPQPHDIPLDAIVTERYVL